MPQARLYEYLNTHPEKIPDILLCEDAKEAGELADVCTYLGIETVVFDRNISRYHGRIKAVADGARKGGLKF